MSIRYAPYYKMTQRVAPNQGLWSTGPLKPEIFPDYLPCTKCTLPCPAPHGIAIPCRQCSLIEQKIHSNNYPVPQYVPQYVLNPEVTPFHKLTMNVNCSSCNTINYWSMVDEIGGHRCVCNEWLSEDILNDRDSMNRLCKYMMKQIPLHLQ